ncbi:MAG TPA: site-specific integrase [Pyrinomonadaceae bacterium]|nr:site-specific integrase [Pyrinomonadaceae bacterium]
MPVYRRKWKDKKTGKIRLGSYFFKFDVDGVPYKETVKTARTKKQAEDAERRARQEVHEGVYGGKGRQMLFPQFVNEIYLPWSEQNSKASSHYKHMLHAVMLCEYFDGRTLGQISALAVERFKRERAGKETKYDDARSLHTVNSELTTLSGIFTLAARHRFVRENPCSKVKHLEAEDAPERRLSQDEEKALLESAEQDPPFLKPMIQMALWTGFRQGEIIALEKTAVDFSRNRIFVVNPKWKRDRRKTEGVPMSKEVGELLQRLWEAAQGSHLFADEQGRRLKRGTVDHFFRKACVRAGIEGFRFHDLRHEYGSRLGDADVNLKKIARLMGHSNTKQTERYVHPTDDGLLAATSVAAQPIRARIVPVRLREVERG